MPKRRHPVGEFQDTLSRRIPPDAEFDPSRYYPGRHQEPKQGHPEQGRFGRGNRGNAPSREDHHGYRYRDDLRGNSHPLNEAINDRPLLNHPMGRPHSDSIPPRPDLDSLDHVDEINMILTIHRDHEFAMRKAQNYLKKHENSRDKRIRAHAYVGMGMAYFHNGNDIMALEYFHRYFDLKYYTTSLLLEVSKNLNHLNANLLDETSTLVSIELLEAMADTIQHERRYGMTYTALANSYLILASIMNAKGLKDKYDQVLKQAGHYIDEERTRRQIRGILKKRSFPEKGTLNILSIRARYLILSERYREAIEALIEDYNFLSRANHKMPMVNTALSLAGCYYNLGILDSALLYLEVGLDIEDGEIGMDLTKLHLLNAVLTLAKVYEQKNDLAKATRYFNLYVSEYRSYRNNQLNRVLLDTRTKYESDKKANEIMQQQESLSKKNDAIYVLITIVMLVVFLSTFLYRNYLEKKRSNAQLEIKNQKILEQSRELEKLSDHKEALTGMIVHDLKDPLNSIIGLSGSKIIDHGKSHYINVAGKKMLDMVLNILDIQKLEETNINLNIQAVRLGEMIESARLDVAYLSDDKNVRISFDSNTDFMIDVDYELMARVLVNVLSNAIKYSGQNDQVEIEAFVKEEGWLQVTVKDHGPGIPKEQIQHVFKKFWQYKGRKSGNVKSVGLGLSFCKMVVEAHGGQIDVKSEPGSWTKISFTLPIKSTIPLAPSDSVVDAQPAFTLSENQILFLKPIVEALSKQGIHDVMIIWKILDCINSEDQTICQWKSKVEAATMSGNEEHFLQLLEMVS